MQPTMNPIFDNFFTKRTQKSYVQLLPNIPTNEVGFVNPEFNGLDAEFKSWFPLYTSSQFEQIESILYQAHINVNYLEAELKGQSSGNGNIRYIDDNKIILPSFISLTRATEMKLSAAFIFKQSEIFNIMRNALTYEISGISQKTRSVYVNFNNYKRMEEIADLYDGNVEELLALLKDYKTKLDDLRDSLDSTIYLGPFGKEVVKNWIHSRLHNLGVEDIRDIFDWVAIGDGRRIDLLREILQYLINRLSAPDFPLTNNADYILQVFKSEREPGSGKSVEAEIVGFIKEVLQKYQNKIPNILGTNGKKGEIQEIVDHLSDFGEVVVQPLLIAISTVPVAGPLLAIGGEIYANALINHYDNIVHNKISSVIGEFSWYLDLINGALKAINVDNITSTSDLKFDSSMSLLTLHILKVASQIIPTDKTIDGMTLDEIYRKNLEDSDSKRLLYVAYNLRESIKEYAVTLHLGDAVADAKRGETNHLKLFALMNLIRLEKDTLVRDKYHTIFDENYLLMRDEYNSLVDFLNVHFGKQCRDKAVDLRDGYWSLSLYDKNNEETAMVRKGIDLKEDVINGLKNRKVTSGIIEERLGGLLMSDKSLYPVPLDIRPSDAFVWQRNARNVKSESSKIYPRIDFFFAYWLEKYFSKNDYYFTDPTFIQVNKKDLKAFESFVLENK